MKTEINDQSSRLNPFKRCANMPRALLVPAIMLLVSGCNATMPTMGGAGGMTATGGAAGGTASGANSALESCASPLGTLSVHEDQAATWWQHYYQRYPQLGSTTPVLRMMIQQSNCFVVVERGNAMSDMMTERNLEQSGEMRSGSSFGKGQMVAADYTMSPSIQFSEQGTGGMGGALGGIIGGGSGRVIAGLAGGMKSNEAATTLLLIDNRSGVQIAASVGSAKNFDFNVFGGAFRGGFAGAGAYSNTPEGKVLTAAFADSFNQMVRSLRNYRAQNVEGGLGKGGNLGVGQ